MQKKLGIAVVAALLGTAVAARAQESLPGSVRAGFENGARQGEAAGGPVGGIGAAAVGGAAGAVGAAAGTVGAILGLNEAPRFRDEVMREHRSSYRMEEGIEPGMKLPRRVAFYPVPPGYHVPPNFRYAVVNDHTVLVNAGDRRIAQVLD